MSTSFPAPPRKHIHAVAADQEVIPFTAVEVQADQADQAVAADDHITATLAVDVQILSRADVESEQAQVIALEANAVAVGVDAEVIAGRVGAVDLHKVKALAPFQEVAAVAVVDDHQVAAVLAIDVVIAAIAEEQSLPVPPKKVVVVAAAKKIVAGTAQQEILARSADQDVVSSSAQEDRIRQSPVELVEGNLIVPVQSESINRGDVIHIRRPAGDGDFAVVHQNVAIVGPADVDHVVLGIADDRQLAELGRKGRRDCRNFTIFQ